MGNDIRKCNNGREGSDRREGNNKSEGIVKVRVVIKGRPVMEGKGVIEWRLVMEEGQCWRGGQLFELQCYQPIHQNLSDGNMETLLSLCLAQPVSCGYRVLWSGSAHLLRLLLRYMSAVGMGCYGLALLTSYGICSGLFQSCIAGSFLDNVLVLVQRSANDKAKFPGFKMFVLCIKT